MVNIQRVRVALTGFPGGPGVATFYALDGQALQTPVHDLFGRLLAKFPSTVTFTVEVGGDIIDPLNGDLMGAWVGAPTSVITGTGTGVYSAPAGVAVNWLTTSVLHGRRLRGRTFMVPLIGNAFATDGSIDATTLASILGSAQQFVVDAATNLVVWHRPNTALGRTGGYGAVTAATVNDKAAVLRSRRD